MKLDSSGAASASDSMGVTWRCSGWGPILGPLLLVLRASLKSAPDGIHERTGIFEILSKESLEIHPRQGGYSFALYSALVLVPTKADPTTRERGCKGCAIATLGAGGVEAILTVDKSGNTPNGTSQSRGGEPGL